MIAFHKFVHYVVCIFGNHLLWPKPIITSSFHWYTCWAFCLCTVFWMNTNLILILNLNLIQIMYHSYNLSCTSSHPPFLCLCATGKMPEHERPPLAGPSLAMHADTHIQQLINTLHTYSTHYILYTHTVLHKYITHIQHSLNTLHSYSTQ